jgi:hypothetical protein
MICNKNCHPKFTDVILNSVIVILNFPDVILNLFQDLINYKVDAETSSA